MYYLKKHVELLISKIIPMIFFLNSMDSTIFNYAFYNKISV